MPRWSLTLLFLLVLGMPSVVASQQLAFPSAEGFGRFSTGGRGGRAININSLSAGSGSGGSCTVGGCSGGTITLRDCLADRFNVGPRTCIFRVGGKIDFGSAYHTFETPPYLTVAGQTAPGNGIALRGISWILFETHNVIVRHIRTRGNVDTQTQPIGGYNSHDLIFDHVSTGWNTDDGHWCSYGSYNCTFQWVLATEGMDAQAFEGPGAYNKCCGSADTSSAGPTFGGITFAHNFYAQYLNRVPWASSTSIQWVNNIVYNVGDASAIFSNGNTQAPQADWSNNYYKTGPQQSDGSRVSLALASACYPPASGCIQRFVDWAVASKIYLSGNFHNTLRPNNSLAEDAFTVRWYSGEPLRVVTTRPAHFPTIPSMVTAANVPGLLTTVGAYATLPQGRDTIDTRGIASFNNDTGGSLACGFTTGVSQCCSNGQCGDTGVYNNGTPYPDSDGDGMSNQWEIDHGLNPNDPSDGPMLTVSGYSNLELFLNWLAGDDRPLVGYVPPPQPTLWRLLTALLR